MTNPVGKGGKGPMAFPAALCDHPGSDRVWPQVERASKDDSSRRPRPGGCTPGGAIAAYGLPQDTVHADEPPP